MKITYTPGVAISFFYEGSTNGAVTGNEVSATGNGRISAIIV